jgi:hypothetical protein
MAQKMHAKPKCTNTPIRELGGYRRQRFVFTSMVVRAFKKIKRVDL